MTNPLELSTLKHFAILLIRATTVALTVFLFLSGIAISAQAQATENKLQKFRTDGCSSFPDGTFSQPNRWKYCCVEHDLAYWKGGTEEERKQADNQLGQCVSKEMKIPFLGKLMYTFVQMFGGPESAKGFRWGYGWTYVRKAAPLNPSELAQIEELAPKSLSPFISENRPGNHALPLPSLTSDYCADEALMILREIDEKAEISFGKMNLEGEIVAKTNLCNGELTLRFNVHSKALCTEPRYTVKPYRYLYGVSGKSDCKDLAAQMRSAL